MGAVWGFHTAQLREESPLTLVATVLKLCTASTSGRGVGAPYNRAVVINKGQAPVLPEGELGALAVHRSITVGCPRHRLLRRSGEPDGEGPAMTTLNALMTVLEDEDESDKCESTVTEA
uniref:Uncharacterized protein n=1 Tax=Oryza glumipatula TaxID=40148 RepID=A0A0E0A5I9_9ORYZ